MDSHGGEHDIETQSAENDSIFDGLNCGDIERHFNSSPFLFTNIDPQLFKESLPLDQLAQLSEAFPAAPHVLSDGNMMRLFNTATKACTNQSQRTDNTTKVEESYEADQNFRNAEDGGITNTPNEVRLFHDRQLPSAFAGQTNTSRITSRQIRRGVTPHRYHPYSPPNIATFDTIHQRRTSSATPIHVSSYARHDQERNFHTPRTLLPAYITRTTSSQATENSGLAPSLDQNTLLQINRQNGSPPQVDQSTKRGLPKNGARVANSATVRSGPEHDFENREIMRLRVKELMQWAEIVNILNERREAAGRRSKLSEAAVYGRFVRNSTRIAELEGISNFDPSDYMHLRKSKGDGANNGRITRRFIAHGGNSDLGPANGAVVDRETSLYTPSEIGVDNGHGMGNMNSHFEQTDGAISPYIQNQNTPFTSPVNGVVSTPGNMYTGEPYFGFVEDQALRDAIDACQEPFWIGVAAYFNTITSREYDAETLKARWLALQTRY